MARIIRLLVVVAVAVGVFSLAALAWAYWTHSGVGTASASVGTLAAPANVTAAPAAGSATVPVTWTSVIGPDGGAVDGYYVQRYSGGTPSPACSTSPTALLAPGATSCSDTGVPDGTYTYTATAVFHSWTAISTPSTAVPVDALSSFSLSAPASATAGTAFTIMERHKQLRIVSSVSHAA